MELFNLLETGLPVFGTTYDVSLNWIGNLIRLLCGAIGVVGVGIIVFSLILKLITLPFDIYQRISMRKQNLQMEANKEKMEKLQKQYANDKEKYNQKVMEMYKENGVSMFSSCLPMILSLIIFIVAINAFNAFAQYSNIENYNTMVNAYNGALTPYCAVLNEENAENSLSVEITNDKDAAGNDIGTKTVTYIVKNDAAGKYIYYKAYNSVEKEAEYQMTKAQEVAYVNAYPQKVYYVDVDKVVLENNAEIMAAVNAETATGVEQAEAVKNYFVNLAQNAVVTSYKDEVQPHMGFLWIKNVWTTDASYKHPVLSYSDFKAEASREKFKVDGKKVSYSKISSYTNAYGEDEYNLVTAKLSAQKKEANGYFVLIALSIGTILLQQFVMQRSQKAQNKYSSVDGQAASQQKMTMIIMTGMFAIFSFMYSSAFSIYMITSNLFSLASTLIINKIVDVKMAKKEAAAEVKRYENHASDRIEKARNAGKESAEESKKKNK